MFEQKRSFEHTLVKPPAPLDVKPYVPKKKPSAPEKVMSMAVNLITPHTKKIDEAHEKSTKNCMREPDMPFPYFKHLTCLKASK